MHQGHGYFDRKIQETPITSKMHLKQRLEEEWAKIPRTYLQSLVYSMLRRLTSVAQAKGLHTKY